MSSENLKRQVNRSKDDTSSHYFMKSLDKGEGRHENPKKNVFKPSPLIFLYPGYLVLQIKPTE